MRSVGWAPIQYDWRLYKRRSGQRDMHKGRPREDTGRRQPSKPGKEETHQKKP